MENQSIPRSFIVRRTMLVGRMVRSGIILLAMVFGLWSWYVADRSWGSDVSAIREATLQDGRSFIIDSAVPVELIVWHAGEAYQIFDSRETVLERTNHVHRSHSNPTLHERYFAPPYRDTFTLTAGVTYTFVSESVLHASFHTDGLMTVTRVAGYPSKAEWAGIIGILVLSMGLVALLFYSDPWSYAW